MKKIRESAGVFLLLAGLVTGVTGMVKDDKDVSVTLEVFSLTPVGQTVRVDWATSAELNNQYFYIDRSTDGVNFEQLAAVPGAGTSSQFHAYVWTDVNPPSGTIYYRLRDFGDHIIIMDELEL